MKLKFLFCVFVTILTQKFIPAQNEQGRTFIVFRDDNYFDAIEMYLNHEYITYLDSYDIIYYHQTSPFDVLINLSGLGLSTKRVLPYTENDTTYIRITINGFMSGAFGMLFVDKGDFTRRTSKDPEKRKSYNFSESKEAPLKDIKNGKNNREKSGSGLFIAQPGYVLTNYHVVKGAKEIEVSNLNNEANKSSIAELIMYDETSDLALLRLKDSISTTLVTPFVFDKTVQPLATNVYVLGYPLITSMGKDVKLTNGVISSKNGFKGNTQSYQISAPVQPGNSGGPLFDNKGNIIGLINAKHRDTENVSYAIKSYVIQQFLENAETPILLNQQNALKDKSIEQIVSSIQPFVVIIKTK